jgi:acyl carrier protein
MTEREVIDLVAEVARDKLGWSGELRPEMRLIEDLELDSIRLLELAVEIENRLRVRLDEEEEQEIETVGDLATLVRSKLDDDR